MTHLGLNVPHKCRCAKEHAENIDRVVAIPRHLAGTSAIYTTFLFGLDGTREWFRDECALEIGRVCRLARMAGRYGKVVDQTQDKVSRECATEVGNAKFMCVSLT
jgi:hypothetical protein